MLYAPTFPIGILSLRFTGTVRPIYYTSLYILRTIWYGGKHGTAIYFSNTRIVGLDEHLARTETLRKEVAEKVGLGFDLSGENVAVAPIAPKIEVATVAEVSL